MSLSNKNQGDPGMGVLMPQYVKSATGGDTVQDIGGYRIHTFTTVGTSTFTPATSGLVEVLVVAGGGGGGGCNLNSTGGGGGAGELVYRQSVLVNGTTTVTVGKGGNGGVGSTSTDGTNGDNSGFGTLTALGGGFGGTTNRVGNPGGSGGGGGRFGTGGASTAVTGLGNAGGSSNGSVSGKASGGGGGGALSVGQDANTNTARTPGGTGYTSSISSTSIVYATGGAGGARNLSANGTNGSLNTGNGADGGDGNAVTNGGAGGSGIVIVRYPLLSVTLTGTPLFSQLSSAASSSAVGAFSLRAVNGTTAKAVNVLPNAPLPPAFTAPTGSGPWSQTLTGYAFGASGTYISNNSTTTSQATYPAWKAFDGDVNTFWYSGPSKYDTSTNNGAYLGAVTTTISGVATPGEWVDVQFPTAVSVYSYSLTRPVSGFSVGIYPKTFKIAGSNDGTTWDLIDAPANQTTYTTGVPVIFTLASPSAVYNRFRMCVSNIIGTTSSFGTGIGQWTLYGSNASWTSDFYADRLGNLLTAPVTGQTLANWLGGATGYVTTWYDQSGRGNHASQATAANQPIIQKATKGPGYMVNFNGTSQFVTLSADSQFLNGTNLIVNAVALRTATVSRPNYIIGTNSPTVSYQRFFLGFASDTSIAMPVTGAPTGITIPAYNASNEPVIYMTGGLTPSRVLYQNNVLGGTNVDTALLSVPSGYSYSIGYTVGAATYYYQGNLFELLIFTSALNQTQVTQIYQNQLGYTGT